MDNFKDFVQQSALSPEDKELWNQLYALPFADQIKELEDFIGRDPVRLDAITQNLKMKKKAIEAGDKTLMEKIIEEEETLTP